MKFNFITLFPNLVTPYFTDSILGRACQNGIIEINCINPRNYTKQKHNKVDEYMVGGGAGPLLLGSSWVRLPFLCASLPSSSTPDFG